MPKCIIFYMDSHLISNDNFLKELFFFQLCCLCTFVKKSLDCKYKGLFLNSHSYSIDFSVQFSHSVMSDSLQPHESLHTRRPCLSPTPGVHPNSCPSNLWCHPAISSSVIPFSSCPQSLPASVFSNELTLLMRWPKYWSFSFSISPSNEHPRLISFKMDWLQSKGP